MSTRAYVIIASGPGGGGLAATPDRHRTGRHRLGTPGTAPRYPGGLGGGGGRAKAVLPRPGARRARHRRTDGSSGSAVRYTTLVVLLGTLAVSGWFAASGASAVAQMIQP